jgi:hypothetical protein
MPNWCQSTLYVMDNEFDKYGSERVSKFYKENCGEAEYENKVVPIQLDFSKSVPEPSSANDDPDYDWYNWRLSHWGTKWNLHDDTMLEDSSLDNFGIINYSFSTAWSPPIEWLQESILILPLL